MDHRLLRNHHIDIYSPWANTDTHHTPSAYTHITWRLTLNRCYPEFILPLGTSPEPKELCSADENIPPASATSTPCPKQLAVQHPLIDWRRAVERKSPMRGGSS